MSNRYVNGFHFDIFILVRLVLTHDPVNFPFPPWLPPPGLPLQPIHYYNYTIPLSVSKVEEIGEYSENV